MSNVSRFQLLDNNQDMAISKKGAESEFECTELVWNARFSIGLDTAIHKLNKYWFGQFETRKTKGWKQDFSSVCCNFSYHFSNPTLARGPKLTTKIQVLYLLYEYSKNPQIRTYNLQHQPGLVLN